MMHATLFLSAGFQLAVTVFVANAPFISATRSPSQPGLHSNDLGLPDGWVGLGCYSDNPSQRTLTSFRVEAINIIYRDHDMMTVGFCSNYCNNNKKALAGLEDGKYCYCGNTLTNGSTKVPPKKCTCKCAGNNTQYCGGPDYLSLYWNGTTLQRAPSMPPHVSSWTLMGCFEDSNDARTLKHQITLANQWNNSAKSCIKSCASAGYSMAGMEFGVQCWCDNGINYNRQAIDPMYCMLACPGNSFEICGGPNSITVYAKILPY